MPSNALSGANDNESSYTFWMSALQNYTECELTYQGDKTIAIWSIAKLLRDVMEEEYAVGMWSKFLEDRVAINQFVLTKLTGLTAKAQSVQCQYEAPDLSVRSVQVPNFDWID
jgi:hypothetical protein